jgi:hypothetical protein
MNKRLVQLLFFGSLVLLAVALWQRKDLPQYRELDPALLKEPEQVAVKRAPFNTTVNGVTYTIKPHRVFDPAALSNDHLLTDRPGIARAMRKVRIGDQVRFRGHLAEYSHNHEGRPFSRGTSTVRNDTGNGACETIFVEEFEILRRGGGPWHAIL